MFHIYTTAAFSSRMTVRMPVGNSKRRMGLDGHWSIGITAQSLYEGIQPWVIDVRTYRPLTERHDQTCLHSL